MSRSCGSGECRGCHPTANPAAPGTTKLLLAALLALARFGSVATFSSFYGDDYYDNGYFSYGGYGETGGGTDDGTYFTDYYSGYYDNDDPYSDDSYEVRIQDEPAEAVTNRFHYVVSVGVEGDIVCAGWIYRDNLAVTAAHCIPDEFEKAALSVHFERYDLMKEWDPSQSFKVAKVAIHPEYDAQTMRHDVAVLLLDGMAGEKYKIFSANPANVQDISEIERSEHRYCNSGCELSVIGWGQPQQENQVLTSYMQKGVAVFTKRNECASKYQHVREVTLDMLCTRSEAASSSCAGSDGAPLVLPASGGSKDIVVGIMSWGDSCTTPGNPAVYSSMAEAKVFIEQKSLELGGGYK